MQKLIVENNIEGNVYRAIHGPNWAQGLWQKIAEAMGAIISGEKNKKAKKANIKLGEKQLGDIYSDEERKKIRRLNSDIDANLHPAKERES